MVFNLSLRLWMLAATGNRKVSCWGTLTFEVKEKNSLFSPLWIVKMIVYGKFHNFNCFQISFLSLISPFYEICVVH